MELFSFGCRLYGVARKYAGLVTGRAVLLSNGVETGRNLTLYGAPIISRVKGSRIRLGNSVVLCSSSYFTALGVTHPVVMRTLRERAEIVIGDDVGMSGATICAMTRVAIGNRTMLGANVMIVDTDFHPIASPNRRYDNHGIGTAAIEIGANVFIGANSIVLKGVRIGDNSVIGAGSVVTRDVPANVVAAGNPCKMLKGLPTSGNGGLT
jgi:acetyltransferase-like isoleucine patch superfamily enzyme